MKSVAVLFCVVTVAWAITSEKFLVHEEWTAFKMEHKKEYMNSLVESYRKKIYLRNKYKIVKHNQQFLQGRVSYSVRMNRFGDMLPDEFMHTMNGFNMTAAISYKRDIMKGIKTHETTFIPLAHVSLPDQIDWREMGAVTEVKDQQRCGSCWAFSSTGALEGQHFRKTGSLVSLSEQNLVDCSWSHGNNGCNGGIMDKAFNYIRDNGGIDKENSYPYVGVSQQCSYDAKNSGAEVTGLVDLPLGSEQDLMAAVATVGPVSVAIDASQDGFQFYSKGIYNDKLCSTMDLNHAVLVVGYGTDKDGGDYWLVKNSWGQYWGDNGYIKMARNKHNQCGIATMASYPLV